MLDSTAESIMRFLILFFLLLFSFYFFLLFLLNFVLFWELQGKRADVKGQEMNEIHDMKNAWKIKKYKK